MRRVLTLLVVGGLGCRFNFDGLDRPNDDARADAAGDADVPSVICKVDRLPIGATPVTVGLAIAATAEGYGAMWVDTTGAVKPVVALLSPSHAIQRLFAYSGTRSTRIGGIADIGSVLMVEVGDDTTLSERAMDRNLMLPQYETIYNNAVIAHSPFPSNNTPQRAFVYARDTSIVSGYVPSDGSFTPNTTSFMTTGSVTELACADGPNHGHCLYTEALASGSSQCTARDLVFTATTPGIGGGHLVVSSDCHDARLASGPAAVDTLLAVWRTSSGSLEARYVALGGGVDVARRIADTGTAPKVLFDGTQFWVAWLDADQALRLTSFDTAGKTADYPLTDWHPLGPEAFALVSRGSETALVMLSVNELEFLTLCE